MQSYIILCCVIRARPPASAGNVSPDKEILRSWSKVPWTHMCLPLYLVPSFIHIRMRIRISASEILSPRRTSCPIFNPSISASDILSIRFAVVTVDRGRINPQYQVQGGQLTCTRPLRYVPHSTL
jgi:hypothetical protein